MGKLCCVDLVNEGVAVMRLLESGETILFPFHIKESVVDTDRGLCGTVTDGV